MATKQQIVALQRRRAVAAMRQRAMRSPTRRPSPDRGGRALIEEVVQPLYDTETVSGGSTAVSYFSRPKGQAAVAGNTKTLRDTNLETAGQLARPKVHVVTGIRTVISGITGDGASTPAVTIPDYTDYVSTLRALLGESLLRVFVGTKGYLELPLSHVPGNVGLGLGGYADIEGDTVEGEMAYSLFSRGDYFSLLPNRIRIPSLQVFGAEITWPRAAVNSVAVPVKVTVVLDGVNGREVQ